MYLSPAIQEPAHTGQGEQEPAPAVVVDSETSEEHGPLAKRWFWIAILLSPLTRWVSIVLKNIEPSLIISEAGRMGGK